MPRIPGNGSVGFASNSAHLDTLVVSDSVSYSVRRWGFFSWVARGFATLDGGRGRGRNFMLRLELDGKPGKGVSFRG